MVEMSCIQNKNQTVMVLKNIFAFNALCEYSGTTALNLGQKT